MVTLTRNYTIADSEAIFSFLRTILSDPPRNHPALEHLVGDGRRHFVDEGCSHFGIILQNLYRFLFLRWLRLPRLAFLLKQLLTRSLLVFVNDLVGDRLHDRILGG